MGNTIPGRPKEMDEEPQQSRTSVQDSNRESPQKKAVKHYACWRIVLL
jgi:hypothetical protein